MTQQTQHVSLPFFGIPRIAPYVRKYRRTLIGMVTDCQNDRANPVL